MFYTVLSSYKFENFYLGLYFYSKPGLNTFNENERSARFLIYFCFNLSDVSTLKVNVGHSTKIQDFSTQVNFVPLINKVFRLSF